MDKRRDISKDKLASGLLRGAVVSGLAAGLAAASLGGVPTANGTCIGISGINIGGGCFTTVGSFALGLGPNTTASAIGFLNGAVAIGLGNEPLEQTQAASFGFFNFAWADGPDTFAETNGNANLAVVQGENAQTVVGAGTAFDNVNIGINVGNGFDTGVGFTLDRFTNSVGTFGQGNIAVNIFGNSVPGGTGCTPAGCEGVEGVSTVQAGGIGTMPLSVGFANAAYNFFGDGNQVTVGDEGSDFGLGFSVFGDRNIVNVNGPLAAGGALFQSDRLVEQTGPGIEINGDPAPPPPAVTTLSNSTGSNTNVPAAGGTQRSLVRPSLNFAPGINSTSNLRSTSSGGPGFKSINQLTSSAKKFGDQLAASTKKFGDQLAASAKKFSDSVNAARAGAKGDAASSSDDDSEK